MNKEREERSQTRRWARWKDFEQDRSGAIAIMAALSLPVVLGFVALSVEYGHGLLRRVENQRAADIAAYAGAIVFTATNSVQQMTQAVRNAAALNGIAPDDVTVTLATSPRNPANQAVHVTITTENTLYLAPILGVEPTLSIGAESFASFGVAESSCILALDESGTGITLSDGVKIEGECFRVSSNAGISASCGTGMVAESVTYFSGAYEPCKWDSNFVKPDGSPAPVSKQFTEDPLRNNAGVATFDKRFETIRNASWVGPLFSMKAGPDLKFAGEPPLETAKTLREIGCTYDPSYFNESYTSRWVITCKEKTINIGTLELRNDTKVQFNTSGEPDTVYNFSGGIISSQGGSLAFGRGTFNIAKGVSGADVSFGAGTFRIGEMNLQWVCEGYSICSGGSDSRQMTFGGPSRFVLDSGIYTGAGARLTLGSGRSNSYEINIAGKGDGIRADGHYTYFADATANNSVFRVNGNIVGGAGSCIVLPASEHHDVSGNVDLAGALKLGAGIYTIDGYFAAGVGGANCDGDGGVYGEDVTLLISGVNTAAGGACRGQIFCIDDGNGATLLAPESGPYAGLAVIGPRSPDITGGVTITSGGRGSFSGAFYFPNAKINMGGGGRIESGSTDCLQLVGASISLSGGAKAMSECKGANRGGGVALIQ